MGSLEIVEQSFAKMELGVESPEIASLSPTEIESYEEAILGVQFEPLDLLMTRVRNQGYIEADRLG